MTDGHKKALELIAENKRTRSPFLDLGNLGLTEVPEEVFECVWLEFLSFGTWTFVPRKKSKYTLKGVPPSFYKKQATTKKPSIPNYDTYFTFISKNDSKKIQVQWTFSKYDIEINSIKNIPTKLNKLDKLIGLVFNSNKIMSINPEFIIENKFIDLSSNKIFFLDKKIFILNIRLAWELHPPFDNFLFNMYGTIGWSGIINQPSIVLLNDNPLMSPPLEIFKKGEKAIDAYFQSFTGDSPTLLEFFSESEFDGEHEKQFKKRMNVWFANQLKEKKESKPLTWSHFHGHTVKLEKYSSSNLSGQRYPSAECLLFEL